MPQQMDEQYFTEKKSLACDAIREVIREATHALAMVESTQYTAPDLIDPNEIHEMLKIAALRSSSARRDFEKSRWASARTSLDFNSWLKSGPGKDLD